MPSTLRYKQKRRFTSLTYGVSVIATYKKGQLLLTFFIIDVYSL